MPIGREIIYPQFLECCQYAENSFWKNIFEDLAYGKCPYGAYIHKGFISCNYKGKEFSYKIEKKESEVVHDDIFYLFSEKLGILSQEEKAQREAKFHRLGDQIKASRTTWSNIRRKNVKDSLIEKYAISMKKRYNLSHTQTRRLLSIIFIGMMFKVFTSDDVLYENGEIKSIKGINFKMKQIILKKNIYKCNTPICSIILPEQNMMAFEWDKYVVHLRKFQELVEKQLS